RVRESGLSASAGIGAGTVSRETIDSARALGGSLSQGGTTAIGGGVSEARRVVTSRLVGGSDALRSWLSRAPSPAFSLLRSLTSGRSGRRRASAGAMPAYTLKAGRTGGFLAVNRRSR